MSAKKRRSPPAEAKVRPPLLRIVVSLLKLTSGIAIVVGAATALTWGLYRYARTTPRFAVQEIEISGSRRMTDDQVAKLGGLQLGHNIFGIDTRAVEQRLVDDPWISEAQVSRRLPTGLRVDIVEREALAVTPLGGQLFLLTRTGEPFKAVEAGDPIDLPVVTGIDVEQLAQDRPRELERIAIGMEVLRHYERMALSKVHAAQEVHVAADGRVTLSVGKEGTALHLGFGPWRKKLTMASRVVGLSEKRGQTPGIVFLDNQAHPERVVVRMR